MKYISTRQGTKAVSIKRAMLDGLAPDGGLYVPCNVPELDPSGLSALADAPMDALAFAIFKPFVTDEISDAALMRMMSSAYASFRHPSIAPLVEVAPNRWIMELFHGPTLAFKDLALQVLAPFMEHFLNDGGHDAFILCATSGDTGGAALSAFSTSDRVKALVLYPLGGVSKFQEEQMQHLASQRCRVVAVDGTFDDCQRLVKSLLAKRKVAQQFGLTAVNSVNWGRIMAQTVYYAKAALKHGTQNRPVNFVVPTGNFGNAYAGVLAKRMGFPIGQIIVANNANDTLHRALNDGVYEPSTTLETNTPAMDIQAPSNFERMVFDADPSAEKAESMRFLEALKQDGKATVPDKSIEAIRKDIVTRTISNTQTDCQIKVTYETSGYIADPHTALALAAADQTGSGSAPTVVLATAHPVKFAQIVGAALRRDIEITAYRGASFDCVTNPPVLAADEDSILEQIGEIVRA